MSDASGTWTDTARQRLVRVLGDAKATVVFGEILDEMGVNELSDADALGEFGDRLSRRGGFLAAVGVSLKTHALLRRPLRV